MLSYTSTSPYLSMAWCLVKHRDNFYCTIVKDKSLVARFIGFASFIVTGGSLKGRTVKAVHCEAGG
jgi:hypothetical protein